MLKNLKKRTEGFTIIEVLIVLAIAGLIMLVVFLAVPALQRNSRNTQRKADVSAVLGAVSDFTTNNNGAIPAVSCGTAPEFTFHLGTCAAPTGTPSTFKLGYYSAAPTVGVQSAANNAANTADTIRVVTSAKCAAAGAAQSGAARGVAILYSIETGSGSTPTAVCTDS
jgi:prepilin-type N-terminal cleavage/methylation domain-containing protein